MPAPLDVTEPLRPADLPKSTAIDLALVVTPDMMSRIEARLALSGLRKLRLTGRLIPYGQKDWHLQARLGATAVQSCIATDDPVVTRIDTDIERIFVADWKNDIPDSPEAEIPEDDRYEPLGDIIDLEELASEALALALPDFPRRSEAPPVEISAMPPGAKPLNDTSNRPFSGLAMLKKKLEGDT